MSPIRLKILGFDTKRDALTRKDGVEGVTVEFDGEQACFLSWKSLRMMLVMKAEQGGGTDPLAAMTGSKDGRRRTEPEKDSPKDASIPIAIPAGAVLQKSAS